MPPKKKGESTLDKIFGYSTTREHNVENTSNIPDLNDETNKDMDDDLPDDLEMFGHGEKTQEGKSSGQRKRKTSTTTKHEFLEEWKIKNTWVYSINVEEGKTRMKRVTRMVVLQFNKML